MAQHVGKRAKKKKLKFPPPDPSSNNEENWYVGAVKIFVKFCFPLIVRYDYANKIVRRQKKETKKKTERVKEKNKKLLLYC